MASNLRVDTILPSTGTSLGIGTASGTTTVTNNLSVTGSINAASATITGNLGVGGTLTYEDVTNIDSVGVITARSGIRIGTTGANTLLTGNSTRIDVGNHIRITGGTDHDIEFQNGSGRRKFVGGDSNELELGSYSSSNSSRNIFLQIASSGNITANTGNLVIGTAGKGIDYSAQTASGIAGVTVTSEIFVHYEEGTFTPFISANSSAPSVSYGAERGGRYTRIGNMVFYSLGINLSSYSGGSGAVYVGGFPYVGAGTPGWDGAHVIRDSGAIGLDSRTNTLGAWMETSAVAGYPILYIQSMSSTSSFAASFVQAGSMQAGRLTVHGQYHIG